MVSLTNSIGKPEWAPLIVRTILGFYYIVLGVWGYQDSDIFHQAVERYTGSSGILIDLFALLSPYIFLACGALMIAGFLTSLASLISLVVIAMLLLWSGAFALVGDGLPQYIAKRNLIKDLVVFGANASVLFSGPGALSFDKFFRSLYQR